jgi:Flp pilus assembly pilin Flp
MLIFRLLYDDRGQDVIEYALLMAGIGIVGIATWPAITAGIGAAYGRLDTSTNSLWRVPDPQ